MSQEDIFTAVFTPIVQNYCLIFEEKSTESAVLQTSKLVLSTEAKAICLAKMRTLKRTQKLSLKCALAPVFLSHHALAYGD